MSSHRRLLLALILFFGSAHASTLPSSWSYTVPETIQWQQMTAVGTLIVATRSGLRGVDIARGTEIWKQNVTDVTPEYFEEIPGTSLVVFSDTADDTNLVIMDAFTGTRVFDSRAEGLTKIVDRRVMAPARSESAGSLLIAGFETGKPKVTLFLYDISTGQRLWKSDVLHAGKNGLMNLMTALVVASQNISPITISPVELPDGTFLIGAGGDVLRMQLSDGAVVWKQPSEWGAGEIFLSSDFPDRAFMGVGSGGGDSMDPARTTFHALSLATGASLWPEARRFSGAFNPEVVFTDQGLLISEETAGKGRLRLLDYETGESLWGKKGKGIKIKGAVRGHAFHGDLLTLTTGYDSAWNDEGVEYHLYVVKQREGILAHKKPVKVRGQLLATVPVSDGLAFITTHQVNVLDLASGTLRHDHALRSKRGVKAVASDDTLYVFNADDGSLHTVDLLSGQRKPFATQLAKLENRDVPLDLEVREGRVVLTGRQTVVVWNSQGEVAVNAHHPAPKRPALLRALLYAQAVRSAAASVAAGAYAAGFAEVASEQPRDSVGQALASGLSEGYATMSEGYGGLTGQYWRAASERFQASQDARDFVFMLVRQENRRYGLAQVSKDTGSIVATIDLGREKDPAYQLDDIGGYLFQQVSKNTIDAYRFGAAATQLSQR